MKRRLALAALAVLTSALGVSGAQARDAVLAEDQVSEEALLSALDPPVTRAWKGAQRPPAKASLLITFVTNSAELSSGSHRMLDLLAAAMKNERLAQARFAIEGHADKRGGEALNRRLSQERAASVRDYLVARHGLDAARLQPVGKGSSEPLNARVPAAPENRRVTIVARRP